MKNFKMSFCGAFLDFCFLQHLDGVGCIKIRKYANTYKIVPIEIDKWKNVQSSMNFAMPHRMTFHLEKVDLA